MQIKGDSWAYILVGLSIAILTIRFGVVTFDSAGINAVWITISSIGTNKLYVLLVVLAGVIAFSAIANIVSAIPEIASRYMIGYKANKSLIEIVTREVVSASKSKSPSDLMVRFRPQWRNIPIECGRFTRQEGGITPEITIRLTPAEHSAARLSGVRAVVTVEFVLCYIVATLIGIFAIVAMMI